MVRCVVGEAIAVTANVEAVRMEANFMLGVQLLRGVGEKKHSLPRHDEELYTVDQQRYLL